MRNYSTGDKGVVEAKGRYTLGWVNMFQIVFRFFNVFIVNLVPKQANFCESLQKLPAKIECCVNFLAVGREKLYKIYRELIFCSKISVSKVFKHNLTVPI